MTSTSSLCGALLLAVAACGQVADEDPSLTEEQPAADDPAQPADPAPQGAEFRFFTSRDSGGAENVFSDIGDAYLNANGSLGVAPGDYFFSVTYEICVPGQNQDQFFPQQSPEPCRTFGVGANGTITRGTPAELDGEACGRLRGTDELTGGITLQLMPFERHVHACGTYVVYVVPAGMIAHPTTAVATLFFNAPSPEPVPGPVCGNGIKEDGEHCDDGNEADHDGCSATCEHEPGCDAH